MSELRPPLANSYWVLPGRLLAGEYPATSDGQSAAERIELLRAAGISCFIDLTEPGECEPYENLLPLEIEYLRKPIPDQQVPRATAHMHEIQMELDMALESGRAVYVHCRAGIGRTGTVIGCFLIERGAAPERALELLNELWKQCARSASWPLVPQTEEQADYIRDWRPRHEPAPVAPRPVADELPLRVVGSLRERFLGALLGLATGDALAAATQYRRPKSFPNVGDLLGGGPFDLPRGAWSDDTAMALCLAASLSEKEQFDPRDQLQRYVRWQREGYLSATGQCVGITASTARALALGQRRRQPYSGSHDPTQLDPEPLSRVAPAVLFSFADAAQAIQAGGDAARVTCQAPLVVDACRLLAALVHAALRGEPRAQLLKPSPAQFSARPLHREVEALLDTIDDAARANGGALDVLRLALRAFHATDNFRDGALLAVNQGGNSDVIGAVYGQLAGAHYGVNAIPPGWLAALALRDKIESLADALLTSALVRVAASVRAS
ncbi:MAG: ADP-ribosylglycohydrolase family protein [Steroidobacteraceae bacterium]